MQSLFGKGGKRFCACSEKGRALGSGSYAHELLHSVAAARSDFRVTSDRGGRPAEVYTHRGRDLRTEVWDGLDPGCVSAGEAEQVRGDLRGKRRILFES